MKHVWTNARSSLEYAFAALTGYVTSIMESLESQEGRKTDWIPRHLHTFIVTPPAFKVNKDTYDGPRCEAKNVAVVVAAQFDIKEAAPYQGSQLPIGTKAGLHLLGTHCTVIHGMDGPQSGHLCGVFCGDYIARPLDRRTNDDLFDLATERAKASSQPDTFVRVVRKLLFRLVQNFPRVGYRFLRRRISPPAVPEIFPGLPAAPP